MIERPILFSAAMVRALLDGRKTQTRRVMKPQPQACNDERGGHQWPSKAHRSMLHVQCEMQDYNGPWCGLADDACPYGTLGDRLWVRESHMRLDNRDGGRIITYKAGGPDFVFMAGSIDDDWRGDSKWTPSIHMRREYSRILLEITNVRVERVQEISQRDVFAEGIKNSDILPHESAQQAFSRLWDSINAARGFGWPVNPWVWVITFITKASL